MSESVNLPALGESVTEGTVTRWLKSVGDRVEVDEPLLEVSTDKVDTEIPSPIAGIIEAILVAEDATVEIGTPLVTIGTGATTTPVAAPAPIAEAAPVVETAVVAPAAAQAIAPQPPVAVAPVAVTPASVAPVAVTPAAVIPVAVAPAAAAPGAAAANAATNAGYVTPLVRKLAHDKGVNLSALTGTGVGGRIRKQDIIDAQTSGTQETASGSHSAAVAVLPTSPLRGTTVPMSRLRKVIAERAVISMQSSAQLTSVVEIDVTRVANFRDSVKADFATKTGVKLSFLPFFALAAAEALKAYPIVNATIEDDQIVYPAQENISIAVDTERGLLTPVIRDAGSLTLAGFAREIADLAERTRENKLKPDELAGGTFTLTNTGSRGALFDTPIVFLPQSAILGTGIVVKRPIVVSDGGLDAIAIRSMVYLALSYDHRIVDGADAARFLVAVKNRLEGGDFAGVLGA
jgi:2-oxoglutarate dehydrogenase E2 component (dihydrolipoamide succinyltransferase)